MNKHWQKGIVSIRPALSEATLAAEPTSIFWKYWWRKQYFCLQMSATQGLEDRVRIVPFISFSH